MSTDNNEPKKADGAAEAAILVEAETSPADGAASAAAESAAAPEPSYASIDDLMKIEMKIGKILEAVPVEGSEKLLRLTVDFAEAKTRQVLSGIAKFVTPEELIGNSFPFVTNLKPRMMMGLESQAMILAVNDDANFALLKPTKEIRRGSPLK